MEKRTSAKGRVLVRGLLGAALLVILAAVVDWRVGLSLLPEARGGIVFLAWTLFPVSIAFSALKWDILLRAQGLVFSRLMLLRCYWIGFFFNNLLPSSVGGDVSRVALLRRSGRLAEVTASVAAERLTGVAVLLLLAAVGLVLRPGFAPWPGLLPLFWLMIAGGLSILAALFLSATHLVKWMEARKIPNGRIGNWAVRALKVARALSWYRGHGGALGGALLLSIPFYAVSALFHMLLFMALRVEISPVEICLAYPLVALAGLIPFSINALGLTEGAFVLFYSQAGARPSEALAAALLARLLGVAASAVGGILYVGGDKMEMPQSGAPR